MIKLVVCALLICSVGSALAVWVPNVPYEQSTFKDAWDYAIEQAQNFVAKLTLDEKAGLATGVGWQNGPCVGNTPAISRLNFSGYCLEDSPTGVRFTDFASAFPAGINAAATWDRALIYARAVAMGEEYRGKGVNVALGPMMNMGRVAAGGRNWEGSGADPYLTGEAAAYTVLGIQSQGVSACAKHYIGNEQEHYRNLESSNIDDRTLHEIYAYPFLRSVQAGVTSVMCSYNQINNTYACQNNRTLNQVLKGEFGFKGYVMSDWTATMSGLPSVWAGLDMTMPGGITFSSNSDTWFGKHLVDAVNNGSLSLARLDDMAVRIMTPFFLLGQNDTTFPATNFNFYDPSQGKHVNVQGDHYKIIREVGAASNILLKNVGNILPFNNTVTGPGTNTYAIIGSDAFPGVNGPNGCSDHGCIDGTVAQGWGSGTTWFPYLITPMEAIQREASNLGQTVTFASNDYDLSTAKSVAAGANVAIVFSNTDSGEEYITWDGNMGDRNNLSLWENGDALIEAVASVNPNVVVVMHTVGPVVMPWIDNPNIKAVILAGLPGQESGNSLTDVLFGYLNPSGRLPYTLAKDANDYPAQVVYNSNDQYPQIDYTEGLLIDYRWFDAKNITPQFEFGFGLSYTTFEYTGLKVNDNYNSTVTVQIQIAIENTGYYDGYEVPQLYLAFPASAGEPPKVLKGFERVGIQKGSSAEVTFNLTDMDISIWDVVSQSWVVPTGQFGVLVGASSRDIRLTGNFSR